jgi:putative copper resistance protein D
VIAVTVTFADFFTRVGFQPVATVVLAATGWAYLAGVRRVRATGEHWPAERLVAASAAWVLSALVLESGLSAFERSVYTVDVVQSVVIGVLAPVGVALAAPFTLAARAGGPRTRERVVAAFDSRPVRIITRPAAAWIVWGLSVWLVYCTGLARLGVEHAALRDLLRLWLFLAGCVFVWPVLAADPVPRRMHPLGQVFYLLLLMPYFLLVGATLDSARSPVAPGIGLGDSHAAGDVLWTAGELLGVALAVVVLVGWVRAEERHARRADAGSDADVAAQQAAWRASRAAAAEAADRYRAAATGRSRRRAPATDATVVGSEPTGWAGGSPDEPRPAVDHPR